jgi:hypothetical protein
VRDLKADMRIIHELAKGSALMRHDAALAHLEAIEKIATQALAEPVLHTDPIFDRGKAIDLIIDEELSANSGDGDWYIRNLLCDGSGALSDLTDDALKAMLDELSLEHPVINVPSSE